MIRKLALIGVLMPMMALATTWYVNGSTGSDSNSGMSESAPKATIQAAIDSAIDGDTILVASGTYAPISSIGKKLFIRSTNGSATTIIDGRGTSRCVSLSETYGYFAPPPEDSGAFDSVLSGFTVRNGQSDDDDGGGIFGGTIEDCTIENCLVRNVHNGGGVYGSKLYRCIIRNNVADDDGGGIHSCIAYNCLIVGNKALNTYGGRAGGGATTCNLYNCTITGNISTGSSVAALDYYISAYNCIVWGNTRTDGTSADVAVSSVYACCTSDPGFVDAANGDYRLAAGSPCIDAGTNSYVTTTTDLAGNARIVNGTVDIGCYEYGASPVGRSLTDGLVAYWPFDGNAKDMSGNGNNGTTHGVTLTVDRFGNANGAYYFGTGNYISVPDSVSLDSTSNQVSYATWARIDEWYEGLAAILCKGYYQYSFNLNGATPSGTEVGAWRSATFNTLPEIGTWCHLALTYDGTCWHSYLNGVLVGTSTNSWASTPNSSVLEIGRHSPGAAEYLCGALDDLCIYNRALSAAEVKALYDGTAVTPSTTTYTVTFNANGGSGGTTRSVTSGATVGTLPTPTRSGYTFDGWYTTSSGGTKITTSTKVTGNVTYYAHWTASTATGDALYCVIDLSGGANASKYPVAYLNEPPSGGFNVNEYKTTKLVLRRIEAGTFIMGDDQTDESHRVTLTKPFYMGVFEVTQKQYLLVMGSNPSTFSGDMLPVEKLNYDMIRGSSNGAQWPSSSAVDSDSFMGKLRARTGLGFDLPTDAQWEYACRAGTTTAYYWGDSMDGNYAWYQSNTWGSRSTQTVGTTMPNAWGLYDMSGNVWEWCLDWYDSLAYGIDPQGPSSGAARVGRNACWNNILNECASSWRFAQSASAVPGPGDGFRLSCAVSATDDSLTDGLVAYYPFDGDANDMSGNGNNLVNAGASPCADRFGNSSGAMEFNGTSASVISAPSSSDRVMVSNCFTVCFWFQTASSVSAYGEGRTAWNPGNYAFFPVQGPDAWSDSGIGVKLGYDGIQVVEHGANYLPTIINYSASVGTGWNFLSVTVGNNGAPQLYFNGNLVASASDSGRGKYCGVHENEGIGGGGWGYYTGSLDDFRIYNRALSAAEVKALYDGTAVTPSTTTYTVTFNANGGSGGTTRSVTSDAAVGTLPTATREGYTFDGWYTAASGGTKITTSTTVTANVTYYAHWTQITYTVTFNANGGSGGTTRSVSSGSAVETLPTPTRNGYTFDGWYTAASGGTQVSTSTTVTGNVTYYAHWNVVNYTVTFNANGGSGGTTRSVASGSAVGTLPTPTRSGYTFDGWYTAASGGTKITTSTTVSGNVTYYAHWTQITYTVTFNANGGSGGTTRSVSSGSAVETLPTPTRNGYTFDGWYTAASGGTKITTSTTVTANVTYYAHWTQITYTVTFNANGGSGGTTRSVASGSTVGTLPTPTRSGYTFDGWYTATSGGTKITTSTTVTANVTYYAHWTANQGGGTPQPGTSGTYCVVTFADMDSQWEEEGEMVVLSGGPIGVLPYPMRSEMSWQDRNGQWIHFYFDGWWTEKDGGTRISESTIVAGDVTYYGHWLRSDLPYDVGYEENIEVIDGYTWRYRVYDSHSSEVEVIGVSPDLVRTVTIPSRLGGKPVTRVAFGAFSDSVMRGVVIPDSVTKIGGYAFSDCSNLTDVTLPSSNLDIDACAFNNCMGLARNGCIVVGGVLCQYVGNSLHVDIPSGVTKIGGRAFEFPEPEWEEDEWGSPIAENEGYRGPESVTIPEGVTSIGDGAFADCVKLKHVTIPESVTYIGDSAFANCDKLEQVVILARRTSIGSEAFSGCISLAELEIANRASRIGPGAFKGCLGLAQDGFVIVEGILYGYVASGQDVIIPANVWRIENFKAWGNDDCWDDEANCYCGPKRITLPSGVRSFGRGAFSECDSLTSMTIPDGVTRIGWEVFSGCSGLTSVTIPASVTSIGGGAFWDCSGLTSVNLPANLTHIGMDAFWGCSGLASITIPDSVTSIGKGAFSGCTRLAKNSLVIVRGTLYDYIGRGGVVTIPDGVERIDDYVFFCFDEESHEEETEWGTDYVYTYRYVGPQRIYIPDTVTSIGELTFASVANLAIDAPMSLKTQLEAGYAFGAYDKYGNEDSVAIPLCAVTYRNTGSLVVTFNANGGTLGTAGTSKSIAFGAAVGTLPTPTRSGYLFDGWFTAANGGTKITTSTTVSGNVTYYAHWTQITYTVTFNANGGSGGTTRSVTCGSAVGTLPAPTRSGYTFDGWYTAVSGGIKITTSTTVSGNVTYYAHWNANTTPTAPTSGTYCVIDLSAGASASKYPVTYLDAIPVGGWTDEYKMTKLVLKKVEAGSFMMDDVDYDDDRPRVVGSYKVSITKPYYIGVFEVTQKQYELVTGQNPSRYKGDMRPVERVSWDTIRGNVRTCNWPTVKTVDANSFIGRLRARSGVSVDLPTLAQGEYAFRAGGGSVANVTACGRIPENANDGKGGYGEHTKVGSYAPNAWGIYDMYGNVSEWTLDWEWNVTKAVTDPVGPNSSADEVKMMSGSSWSESYDKSYWYWDGSDTVYPSDTYDNLGFRVAAEPAGTLPAAKPKPAIYCDSSYTVVPGQSCSIPITVLSTIKKTTVTVKGLPSGLKYSGGKITGKAKKPGTSKVTITAKNTKGSATKKITIKVKNPGFAVAVAPWKVNGSSVDSDAIETSGQTVTVRVGFSQSFALSVVPGVSGVSGSTATVKVTGLPSGLAYKNGAISGVPRKAGTKTATVKCSNKWGWSKTFTIKIKVVSLPSEVLGTFNGHTVSTICNDNRLDYNSQMVKVTTTSNGKLSAKIGSATWTASSWSAVEEGGYYTAVYTAVLKRSPDNGSRLNLRVNLGEVWNSFQMVGSIENNGVGGRNIVAQRNPFGKNAKKKYINAEAGGIATKLSKYGSMPTAVSMVGGGVYELFGPVCSPLKSFPVAFKVSSSGVVTISGKVGGQNLSGTTVLRVSESSWAASPFRIVTSNEVVGYDEDEEPIYDEPANAKCLQADFCLGTSSKPIRIHVEFHPTEKRCRHGWVSIGKHTWDEYSQYEDDDDWDDVED